MAGHELGRNRIVRQGLIPFEGRAHSFASMISQATN